MAAGGRPMNGTEQQAAGTRYAQLGAQIADVTLVVQAIDRRQVTFGTDAKAAYDALVDVQKAQADQVAQLQDRQREDDTTIAELFEMIAELQRDVERAEALAEIRIADVARAPVLTARTLWQRLCWIVVGA